MNIIVGSDIELGEISSGQGHTATEDKQRLSAYTPSMASNLEFVYSSDVEASASDVSFLLHGSDVA
jgi:hypothetical protein